MIKQKIAKSFSKSANTYDEYAGVQAHIGDQLINYFLEVNNKKQINTVLDLGTGTGHVTSRLLSRLHSKTDLIACDLSYDMLLKAKNRLKNFNTHRVSFLQADFDHLPFINNIASYDLIFSNMSLQWSEDSMALIEDLKTLVSDQGCLAVSIPLGFSHPEYNLPYVLNYHAENLRHHFIKKTFDWSFDSMYDFIQFFKKTGASICHGDNRSFIPINRQSISNLSKKLGKVSIEIAYLIFNK